MTLALRNELAGPAEDIKAAWQQALFTDVGDACLQRYFTFHLEGITGSRDTLPLARELALHLIEHYGTYLDENTLVPADWYPMPAPPPGFAYYTDEMASGCFTLRALRYYARFCSELHLSEDKDETLLDLNFNHLAYFTERQDRVRSALSGLGNPEKIGYLQQELSRLSARPVPAFIYHPDWPPLSAMLCTWLREELSRVPFAAPAQKLGLNLSVAQLACLLKLLYEEGTFATENFSDILRFFAAHFRSKRREHISYGSLSKESYSTGQVTAAVVRDKFDRMIKKIDRHFFPG